MWLKHKQKYINMDVLPNWEVYVDEEIKGEITFYYVKIQLGATSYRLIGLESKREAFQLRKSLNDKIEGIILDTAYHIRTKIIPLKIIPLNILLENSIGEILS